MARRGRSLPTIAGLGPRLGLAALLSGASTPSLLGCEREPPIPAPALEAVPSPVAPPPEPAAPVALSVLYAGCRDVGEGPVCLLGPEPTELRLWAELDPALPASVWIDDARVDAKPEPVDGGLRWRITPPPDATRLELRAELDGTPGRFTLRLDARPRPRALALDRIVAHPDPAWARARLREQLPTLSPEGRALAWLSLGDLASLDGDLDAMIEAYDHGHHAARALGWLGDASLQAQRIAFVCLALRYDEACATRWLERDAEVALALQQRLQHAYLEGLLAEQTGDLRTALRIQREQEQQARAVGGMVDVEAAALTQQMLLVGRLGAHQSAQALRRRAEQLEPALAHGVTRSQLLDAIAWMLLEARGRGVATDDPVPILLRALQLLDQDTSVASSAVRQVLRLNLAYAAVLDADAPAARRWLQQVDEVELEHGNLQWLRLLQARVAGLEGEAELARRRFETLLREASRQYQPELRWQALVGLGRTLEALGRPEPALARYREAERLLEDQLPRIALGEGRERFAAERDRGTRWLVELLLREGRPEQALCAARLARTRALRLLARQLRSRARATDEQQQALQRYREARIRLEAAYDVSFGLPAAAARAEQRRLERQRDDDERALDELLVQLDPGPTSAPDCDRLPAPGPGQLDLHYVQLDDGWVGFAVEADALLVHRLGPADREPDHEPAPSAWPTWSDTVLAPFAEPLARARSIRVMPTGPLARVPFHALPVPGDPSTMLVDLAPVAYGLDLPRADAEPLAADRPRALIVAPPSNLPHAAAEAGATAQALADARWPVQRLVDDAATGEAVRRALPAVDLLHYVGHARSDGWSGWDSALSLARDGTLGVGDVLALPRAPATVVLDGCETGSMDPQALAGGMSLAHAFVLAGSQVVIATTEEIDDAAAAELVEAFYAALTRGRPATASPALAAAAALRRAQQARRDRAPTGDPTWLHTRAWIP